MTVVTGFPNYPDRSAYDGYRVRLLHAEGACAASPSPGCRSTPATTRSAVRRALNFLSFMVSASTLGRLDAPGAARSPWSTRPLPRSGWPVGRCAPCCARPFVLYIQDLWPDTVTATGMVPARLARPVERLLGPVLPAASTPPRPIGSRVISPGMKDLPGRAGGPGRRRSTSSTTGSTRTSSVPVPSARRATARLRGRCTPATSATCRASDVALRAVARLADLPHVRLRFVGDGVAAAAAAGTRAEALGMRDRVALRGRARRGPRCRRPWRAPTSSWCALKRRSRCSTSRCRARSRRSWRCGQPADQSRRPATPAGLTDGVRCRGRGRPPATSQALAAAIRALRH